jgi:DNA polymerase V
MIIVQNSNGFDHTTMENKMAKGGSRPGAGRKANSGVFGEKTVAKRIPLSLVNEIDQFIRVLKGNANQNQNNVILGQSVKELGTLTPSNLNLPLFESRVAAGFPSPADDHLEASLDLNQHLIKHPAATFFVRASGESMINAGIHNNDILVVDRSLNPKNGDIVIASLNGELTVKRLQTAGRTLLLKPENPEYPVIEVSEEIDFLIWGVVTSVIHQYN